MNAKTLKIGLVAALALTLSATAAFAGRGGYGGCGGYGGYGANGQGYGRGAGQAAQLTPEKQEIYRKLVAEYAEKVDKLRADLVAKQTELDVLNNSASPDQAKIAALAKEMGDLHGQLINERSAFKAKVAKEVGVAAGNGGFGGCPGYGRGYAAGDCPGAGGCPGAGPGNCPGYASNCPGYGGGYGGGRGGCAGGCPNAN